MYRTHPPQPTIERSFTSQREIAAHLRPSAPLILVWNLEPTSSHISSTVRHSIYEPYELGTPQYHRGLWRSMFDVPAYNELFEPPQEASYAWSLGMTEESVSLCGVDSGFRRLVFGACAGGQWSFHLSTFLGTSPLPRRSNQSDLNRLIVSVRAVKRLTPSASRPSLLQILPHREIPLR